MDTFASFDDLLLSLTADTTCLDYPCDTATPSQSSHLSICTEPMLDFADSLFSQLSLFNPFDRVLFINFEVFHQLSSLLSPFFFFFFRFSCVSCSIYYDT
ncbi:hypothetical protein Hypma_000555 [Hypsizygus marmoreus]|uniref:Uncharacterized protein n=1 Tax=Hypsizygus marmoreus TaxID=39966 RepID=A0A369JCY1_HYPMA|nr:hypothetical protein Hypma_000555 [Hypsizygus marmoreus]